MGGSHAWMRGVYTDAHMLLERVIITVTLDHIKQQLTLQLVEAQ